MKKERAIERKDYCPFLTRVCTECNFYWEKECVLRKAYIIRRESNG